MTDILKAAPVGSEGPLLHRFTQFLSSPRVGGQPDKVIAALSYMSDFTVLIVGTEHPIHMGAWDAERSSCEAFEKQLIEWCKNEDTDAIAEEMNDKAWERAQLESTVLFDKTVPRKAAEALGLEHMDCDDDPGIPEIAVVRQRGSDDAKELKKRNKRRECHWMRKLVSWRKNRVLFVCGFEHVTSFQEKLENRNIETRILADHWVPQSRSSEA